MASVDDLERIAAAAERPGEQVTGVLAAELLGGARVYLCAYESGAWLALDEAGMPVESRQAVHDAVSLVALCEVAEETAGGGHLDEQQEQHYALRARRTLSPDSPLRVSCGMAASHLGSAT